MKKKNHQPVILSASELSEAVFTHLSQATITQRISYSCKHRKPGAVFLRRQLPYRRLHDQKACNETRNDPEKYVLALYTKLVGEKQKKESYL